MKASLKGNALGFLRVAFRAKALVVHVDILDILGRRAQNVLSDDG